MLKTVKKFLPIFIKTGDMPKNSDLLQISSLTDFAIPTCTTRKEEINKQSKGVTAMKFFKGQENDRLYCKEITKGDKIFVVIMAELRLRKKSQKLSRKEKNIIEKVADYEYEFEK